MLSGTYTPKKNELSVLMEYCLQITPLRITKYLYAFSFSTISFLIFRIFLLLSCNCENKSSDIRLFSHRSATNKADLSFSESSGNLHSIFSSFSFKSSGSFIISSYSILKHSIVGIFSKIAL